MNKNQLNCYASNTERDSSCNTIVCMFAKSFYKLVKGFRCFIILNKYFKFLSRNMYPELKIKKEFFDMMPRNQKFLLKYKPETLVELEKKYKTSAERVGGVKNKRSFSTSSKRGYARYLFILNCAKFTNTSIIKRLIYANNKRFLLCGPALHNFLIVRSYFTVASAGGRNLLIKIKPHSANILTSKHYINIRRGVSNNINANNASISQFNDKIEDINHIISDIITNPLYVRISQILSSSSIADLPVLNDNVNSYKNVYENSVPLKNRDKQLLIEETLRFFWEEELQKLLARKSSLFKNSTGIKILLNSTSKLDKVFNTIKANKRLLKNKKYCNYIILSDNGVLISIVLCNIIPHLMKNNLNQNTATLFQKIGKDIHKYLLHNEWKKYKGNTNNFCIKLNNIDYLTNSISKEEFIKWLENILGYLTFDDYFKLGFDVAKIISNNCNLFKFENIVNREDDTIQRVVIPGEELENEITKMLAIDTEKLVMICKPCKWDVTINNVIKSYNINKYGGRLLNNIDKKEFINKSIKNSGQIKLDNLDIVNSINFLSSVPFAINTQVLKHIFNIIANEAQLFNKLKINELIKLNLHPNSKNSYMLNKYKKYGDLFEIKTHNSQYFMDKSIITSALMFSTWCDSSKDNSIHFNFFIDWRGRIYTDNSYFSYQGSALAKSLIIFKVGSVISDTAIEHLKIYTANCYGLDKLSYNTRLEWFEKNLDKILSVPKLSEDMFNFNPILLHQGPKTYDFYNFILEAVEPFLFLACCVEFSNYYANPTTYLSRLPIYLDATCNGLQHLSTMINDTNLAKLVNIVESNKNEIPNDVYTYMTSNVENKIEEYIKDNSSLVILKNIRINRKLVKPGIMTVTYGSTSRGIANRLKTEFFKQNDLVKGKKPLFTLLDNSLNKTEFDIQLTYSQLFALGKAIHSVLYEAFPDLTLLVKYLKEMNNALKKLKLATIWLSPGGLIIEQKYSHTIKRELITSIVGERHSITIKELNKDIIDLRKQNDAIVPNVVHSFDASNIALLIKNLSSNFTDNKMNLLTIHDCFATNANDVDIMVLNVKLAFIALYSNKSFIDDYHNFILDYIKKSGYCIIEKYYKSKDITTFYIPTIEKKVRLPIKPSFVINKNLRSSILASQYFIT